MTSAENSSFGIRLKRIRCEEMGWRSLDGGGFGGLVAEGHGARPSQGLLPGNDPAHLRPAAPERVGADTGPIGDHPVWTTQNRKDGCRASYRKRPRRRGAGWTPSDRSREGSDHSFGGGLPAAAAAAGLHADPAADPSHRAAPVLAEA